MRLWRRHRCGYCKDRGTVQCFICDESDRSDCPLCLDGAAPCMCPQGDDHRVLTVQTTDGGSVRMTRRAIRDLLEQYGEVTS